MQLSCSTVFPTVLAVVGTCMCCICGYVAIDETLSLFEEFGPVKGRGNPAKDAPPQYYVDSKTGEVALVSPSNPGNIFPSVVRGVQYYLIVVGVVMLISALIAAFITYQSKNAFLDAIHTGRINSWSNPRYMPVILFYLFLLTILWLLTSGLAVLPIVQFVITSQRCVDLNSPHYGPGVQQSICIDLVQYGLVPFREIRGSGYGLICGPGPYNPPWGNLTGLCHKSSLTFNLYITSFAGAGIVIIALIIFISRLVSINNQLKSLFDDRGPGYYKPPPPHHVTTNFSGIPMHEQSKSVYNPNYEHNVLLLDPIAQESSNIDVSTYNALPIPPGGDGVGLKKDYYSSGREHIPSRMSKKTSVQSSSSSVVVDGLEPYPSTKRPRHPSSDSMEKLRPKGSIADVSKKGRNHMHHPSSDLDSDPDVANDSSDIPSDHTRSTSAFRPRPKKRSRSTRSAPNLYRKSSHRPPSRRKPPTIEEYDSPPSDFYLQEDLQRRTSRMNTRARSEY